MRTLKSIGCGFALDDFGVGFSSFSHLKNLPVDYLKIDGSFIRDLPRSSTDQHLVRAMVAVAAGLGKRTIAEFVADAETFDLLASTASTSRRGTGWGSRSRANRARPVAPGGLRQSSADVFGCPPNVSRETMP